MLVFYMYKSNISNPKFILHFGGGWYQVQKIFYVTHRKMEETDITPKDQRQ